MKSKYLIVLVTALTLAGCASAPSPSQPPVSEVQRIANQVCAFVPTAATIIKIFATGLNSAAEMASRICEAVTTRPLADGPGGRRARVNGVAVQGKFVR